MKRAIISLEWLAPTVVLALLFVNGCGSGSTSSDPTADQQPDETADATDVDADPTDEPDSPSPDPVVVTNPDEAAIKALQETGATIKTNDAGRVVGVGMPQKFTADDLADLRELDALEDLVLSWTHVKDLAAIAELKNLKRLDISWAKYITDEHIDDLIKAGQLEMLIVEGTDFSDAGLTQLREEMNNTVVRVDTDVALSGLPVPEPEPPAQPEVDPGGKYAVGDMAPDIAGKDAEGKEFKLSDYRGKVVMLDFYGNWCPPCRAMYPHNRELIEKYEKADFVLLGVNSDPELGTLVRSMDDGDVTWRSWWDGNNGPIATEWQIPFWPSIFIIDQEGVVRYRRSPEETLEQIAKGITGTIDELLAGEDDTPDAVNPTVEQPSVEQPSVVPPEPSRPAANADAASTDKADAGETDETQTDDETNNADSDAAETGVDDPSDTEAAPDTEKDADTPPAEALAEGIDPAE